MNPSRFQVANMESNEPREKKDSRRFWVATIGVTVLIALVAIVFFLMR